MTDKKNSFTMKSFDKNTKQVFFCDNLHCLILKLSNGKWAAYDLNENRIPWIEEVDNPRDILKNYYC